MDRMSIEDTAEFAEFEAREEAEKALIEEGVIGRPVVLPAPVLDTEDDIAY